MCCLSHLQELFRNFLSSEEAAMIIYNDVIRIWIAQNRELGCKLRHKKLDHGQLLLSIASPKGFPYFEPFNAQMAKMQEGGIRERLRNTWNYNLALRHEYVCSSIAAEPDLSIGLGGTRFFYFLLLCGIVLALVIAACESCQYKGYCI